METKGGRIDFMFLASPPPPKAGRWIRYCFLCVNGLFAGSLESAYSLNWGAQKIWRKGVGETLALL